MYSIETALGETRIVQLADGSEVALNGGTKLVLDRGEPRRVELASGEARFTVTHDDSNPFTLAVGTDRLVDVGTVFNVARDEERLRIAVAEGSVRYEGASRRVVLAGGDELVADGGKAVIRRRSVESVGSWMRGSLVYRDTPLQDVAADLSRSLAVKITVAPAIASRKFSGVIQASGGAEVVRGQLPPLLGVRVEQEGANWTLVP